MTTTALHHHSQHTKPEKWPTSHTFRFNPILSSHPCHSPGGSMICHQVNTYLHQVDKNLTRLFLDCQIFKSYRCQDGKSFWERMEKCSQGLLIFQISPRVLVFLVRRLFLRPGSARKPTRWDFCQAFNTGVV